jgi:hypothetical protein
MGFVHRILQRFGRVLCIFLRILRTLDSIVKRFASSRKVLQKNATPFALAVAVTELILKWYPCCQDYTMNRNKKVDSEERFCHWRCRVRGYMEKRPCCV